MDYNGELLKIIKAIVRDYLENEKPADLLYGTYTGSGLKIDGKPIVIGMDMLDIPSHLQAVQTAISFQVSKDDLNPDGQPILQASPEIESITISKLPITLQAGLKAGDRVVVIQKHGAQKYSIIGRV